MKNDMQNTADACLYLAAYDPISDEQKFVVVCGPHVHDDATKRWLYEVCEQTNDRAGSNDRNHLVATVVTGEQLPESCLRIFREFIRATERWTRHPLLVHL